MAFAEFASVASVAYEVGVVFAKPVVAFGRIDPVVVQSSGHRQLVQQ
jgi:hypothetical protein|tara:strand:+ start:21 stop:161 length:141 start_codon:yes stop_codon:yes gene_type:complete